MYCRHGYHSSRLLTMRQVYLKTATGCLLVSLFVTLASCAPSTTPKDNGNRILGGTPVSIEDFPYQLALEMSGRQLCGASVLTEDWALTAAHCVYRQPAVWMVIRAGTSKLLSGGTLHPVQYYEVHEKYDKTLTYDVAVVKVKIPFEFSDVLFPVNLPIRPVESGQFAIVTGWGYMQAEKTNKSDVLLMADIYINSWDKCKKQYGKQLTESMMCAGADNKDTCNGDSGGPLVIPGGEQVGIVSWGYKCGNGRPSVYTNISVVLPWIIETTDAFY